MNPRSPGDLCTALYPREKLRILSGPCKFAEGCINLFFLTADRGAFTRMFDIPLPRPRDINSPELAGYASQIAAVLKGVTGREAASE